MTNGDEVTMDADEREEFAGAEVADIPLTPETGFEIGHDEAWKANLKRSYDEYQDVSLGIVRENQREREVVEGLNRREQEAAYQQFLAQQDQRHNLFLGMQQQLQTQLAEMHALTMQTLQQANRHADVAQDNLWESGTKSATEKMVTDLAGRVDSLAAQVESLVSKL